jgi:hypothetical protein
VLTRVGQSYTVVQEVLTHVGESVLAELEAHFPSVEVLDARGILHPSFYLGGGTVTQFEIELEALIKHFGTDKEVNGALVRALVDAGKLRNNSQWFFDPAKQCAKVLQLPPRAEEEQLGAGAAGAEDDVSDDDTDLELLEAMQVSSAEDEELEVDSGGDGGGSGGDSDNEGEKFKRRDASATPQLTHFWHMLTGIAVYTAEKVSEFARLGDILFVIVAGSLEDERLFSAASFVLSKYRRHLDNSLVKCVRGKVQVVFSLDNFPYERALELWKAAKPGKGRNFGRKE